ncbi:MAG: hypothetical protein R3E87_06910 [Burkholderiaceae bacterium]
MMQSQHPRLQYVSVRGPGPLTKALAIVAGAGLVVVGLMFSIVFAGVALVVGSVVAGWLWWKTRALRRDLRDQMARMQGQFESMRTPEGVGQRDRDTETIIDGDFIRERAPDVDGTRRH